MKNEDRLPFASSPASHQNWLHGLRVVIWLPLVLLKMDGFRILRPVTAKLSPDQLAELERYALGPYGQDNFYSFMAEIWARMDHDTGEIDLDRDDLERITAFERGAYKDYIAKVFTRPLDEA